MNIHVVLVTYNRIEDLKKTLAAYEAMSRCPDRMTVVDNHSTDGTDAFLQEWEKGDGSAPRFQREVLTMERNLGGSGGFARGMQHALDESTSSDTWIFVADDDAVPRPNMFELLERFAMGHAELMCEVVALTTSVYNRDHFKGVHRAVLKKTILGIVEVQIPEAAYLACVGHQGSELHEKQTGMETNVKDYIDIDIYSFVGSMFRADALSKAGVAREDFFIYNDDYEHSVRMGRQGRMLCVPAAVMDHVDNLDNSKGASWRDFYATRNAIIMYREHFGTFYGLMRALRRILVGIASGNPKKLRVICAGIRAGWKGTTGLSKEYPVGWKA